MSVEQMFWLVWSPTGQRPPSWKHATRDGAEREAERLAQQNRGAQFYVLAAVSRSRCVDVVTEQLVKDDGIPF